MADTEKTKAWKKKLAEVMREHPEVGPKFTGRIEVNFNEGGVTKVYIKDKELK
ncbi:MAG: hypothetical protein AB1805_07640 [Nitrospirota bacterium]